MCLPTPFHFHLSRKETDMRIGASGISNQSLQGMDKGPQFSRPLERLPFSKPGDGVDRPQIVAFGPAVFVAGVVASHYLEDLMFNDSNRPAPKPGDGGQGTSGNSGTSGQGGTSGHSGAGGATGTQTNTGGTQGSSGAGGAGGSR
jgi:hypothetical protein